MGAGSLPGPNRRRGLEYSNRNSFSTSHLVCLQNIHRCHNLYTAHPKYHAKGSIDMMFEMVDTEERSDSTMSPSLDLPPPTNDLRRKKPSKSRCFVPIIILLIAIVSIKDKIRYISEGKRFKVQGYVAQIPTERVTSGNDLSPEGALSIEH